MGLSTSTLDHPQTMADVPVPTPVDPSDRASLATTTACVGRPPSKHQLAVLEFDRVSPSLGKPSRKKHLKILDILVVLVSWICLAVAIITITPRLDVAWTLRLQHQLQIIGLMLSIMSQCIRILAPKLWIMMEAWVGKAKLQNFDAIFRDSIMVANAHLVWRALLLAFILLPIDLSLAYKVFVGGYSTHVFGNHRSSYGTTGAPWINKNHGTEIWSCVHDQRNTTVYHGFGRLRDSAIVPANLWIQ